MDLSSPHLDPSLRRRALATYIAVAFAFSWICFAVPWASGLEGPARQLVTTLAFAVAMWGPGIAALVTVKWVLRAPIFSTLGIDRLGGEGWPWVYLWTWVGLVLAVVGTLVLTVAAGLGRLDPSFPLVREAIEKAPQLQALGIAPWLLVVIQVGVALTLAPLINVIFAVGEELGWRALMLPLLSGRGTGRGLVLTGIVWGLWHAPAILQGLNYPSAPVLGVFLMVVFCLILGTLLGWLWLRTGSVWAPAFGHGAINAMAGLPVLLLSGVDLTWGGTLASVAGWPPLALLAVFALRDLKRRGSLDAAETTAAP